MTVRSNMKAISPYVVPVMIIGAGPTGLTLAIDLHQRGIEYRLFEKLEQPMTFSKANTLMSRTLEGFDRLGVADSMLQTGVPLSKGRIYNNDRVIGEFKAVITETPMPFLLNLRQNELEKILRNKLSELGGVIEKGWELIDFEQQDENVIARLVHRDGAKLTVYSQYLIGTDGAHSRVRKGLGLPLEGITYPETFLVTDVHTTLSYHQYPQDATHSWLHKDGFLLGWPYREKNYWHFVFNLTPEQSRGSTPNIQQVQEWVRERVGDSTIKVYDPTWISKFRIHKRSVSKYRVHRVMIIGDAAHLHSPMAGKGLGNSAQEALNLGWKLAAVLQGDAHSDLLNTVEEERLPELYAVMQESEISHRLFMGSNRVYQMIRDHAFGPLLSNPALVKLLVRNNAQLNIHYRRSRLSQQYTTQPFHILWIRGPQAGDRAPDARIETTNGQVTTLFKVLNPVKWNLLVFKDPADFSQIEALQAIVESYHPHICLFTIGKNGNLRDTFGEASKNYGSKAAQLYLIRPDGYVGLRSQRLNIQTLLKYLKGILRSDSSPAISPVHSGLYNEVNS